MLDKRRLLEQADEEENEKIIQVLFEYFQPNGKIWYVKNRRECKGLKVEDGIFENKIEEN